MANTNEVFSNALYVNPEYFIEDKNKLNCDLNGAWTTEYEYYWLPSERNENNLPPFVQILFNNGTIVKNNQIGISTLENILQDTKRNPYHVSSHLEGEKLVFEIHIENKNKFIEWLPFSLYFDPTLVNDFSQQVTIRHSDARSALGDIVYINNLFLTKGCYLNFLVKSPPSQNSAKLILEIKSLSNKKAALSGIFFNKPKLEKEAHNTQLVYSGKGKESPSSFLEKNIRERDILIWSPDSENTTDNLVKVSLGNIEHVTHTGLEFVTDRKDQKFSFNVLKGIAGIEGVNGLEFYLTPSEFYCQEGCELGFYFAEDFKQNVSIFSAYNDKKNTLLSRINTEESPGFEKFTISPTDKLNLRVRITTEDSSAIPIFRGLYLDSLAKDKEEIANEANSSNDEIILSPDEIQEAPKDKEENTDEDIETEISEPAKPIPIPGLIIDVLPTTGRPLIQEIPLNSDVIIDVIPHVNGVPLNNISINEKVESPTPSQISNETKVNINTIQGRDLKDDIDDDIDDLGDIDIDDEIDEEGLINNFPSGSLPSLPVISANSSNNSSSNLSNNSSGNSGKNSSNNVGSNANQESSPNTSIPTPQISLDNIPGFTIVSNDKENRPNNSKSGSLKGADINDLDEDDTEVEDNNKNTTKLLD